MAAVAAADRFVSARPWRKLQIQQAFALDLADQPAIAGCVLGSTGRDYGLSLLLGTHAIEELIAICARRLDAAEVRGTALWFTRALRKDIAPPFDRALISARREGRTAPIFAAQQAGKAPRPPRRAEFHVLLAAMQALELLAEQGRLDFAHPLETGLVTTLVVRGAGDEIEVERVERAAPPAFRPAPVVKRLGQPLHGRRVAVAIPELPIRNASDEVRALVVIDIDSGFLYTLEVLVDDALPLARERVLQMFAAGSTCAQPGRPPVVLVCDLLLEAMVGPELRAAGIDCRFAAEVPAMEEVLSALADHLFGAS